MLLSFFINLMVLQLYNAKFSKYHQNCLGNMCYRKDILRT